MDDNSEDLRDQFYIARAEALNSYALMEQSLSFLFASRLGTAPQYATLIVSKIVNTRARNEVIQRIVDDSSARLFRPFTNSLFTQIGKADGLRNQLVHWHVEEKEGRFQLKPADLLTTSDARMSEDEIVDLGRQCIFLSAVMMVFRAHLDEWKSPSLHARFQQPLRYPPEPDDPLSQIGKEPPAQPSTSEG